MIKVTRLRSIRARTLEELEAAVNALPFKVEIKAGPMQTQEGKTSGWLISFILPEIENLKWESIDLR